MTTFRTLLIGLLSCLLLASANGQESQPDPASLFDDATIAGIGVDLTSLDVPDIAAWFRPMLEKVEPAKLGAQERDALLREFDDAAVLLHTDLKALQDAGGRELWFFASFRGYPGDVLFAALWTTNTRDVATITAWMKERFPKQSDSIVERPGLLLFGSPATLKGLPAAESPRVAAARAALAAPGTEHATIRGLVLPSDSTRKAFEELAANAVIPGPNIPVLPLVRGVRSARLCIWNPPAVRCIAVVDSPDNTSATEIAGTLNTLLNTLAKDPRAQASVPGLDRLLRALRPTTDGVTNRVALDTADATSAASTLTGPILAARQATLQIRAATNLRAVVQACIIYEQNSNKWPEDLQKLLEFNAVIPEMIVDPKGQPLVYHQPTKDAMNHEPWNVVVAHAAFDAWPEGGLWVAFLDGHVAKLATREEFDAFLAKTPK